MDILAAIFLGVIQGITDSNQDSNQNQNNKHMIHHKSLTSFPKTRIKIQTCSQDFATKLKQNKNLSRESIGLGVLP